MEESCQNQTRRSVLTALRQTQRAALLTTCHTINHYSPNKYVQESWSGSLHLLCTRRPEKESLDCCYTDTEQNSHTYITAASCVGRDMHSLSVARKAFVPRHTSLPELRLVQRVWVMKLMGSNAAIYLVDEAMFLGEAAFTIEISIESTIMETCTDTGAVHGYYWGSTGFVPLWVRALPKHSYGCHHSYHESQRQT